MFAFKQTNVNFCFTEQLLCDLNVNILQKKENRQKLKIDL